MASQELRVFVSYSRKDATFTKLLVDALAASKRDVWVDWQDIPLTVDWWQSIREGIESVDNFVFVISPASIASPVCHFEINHAIQNNKRIIPIVCKQVDERLAFAELVSVELSEVSTEILAERDLIALARQSWGALSRHNWLIFDEEHHFEEQFKKLAIILDTDFEHVKSHTRLLQRAIEWSHNEENKSYLLNGDEITLAEAWLGQSANKSPIPSLLHYNFIAQSRKSENEEIAREQKIVRQARNAFILVLVVIVIALVIVSLIFARNNAELQAEAATIQFQSDYIQGQSSWLSTRVPSMGGFPLPPDSLSQTPAIAFLSTATQQARQWEVTSAIFEGVEMMLVPAGCFWMGSNEGDVDEQPIAEICFDYDFWIDRYEVSNAQFDSLGGVSERVADWPSPQQPRSSITWHEAVAFCSLREARLPTEAEWEYAARGSNSLAYPWGNAFEADFLSFGENASTPSDVDSHPEGASWVGSMNMSGNVWEWVTTIYAPYPYSANDGREEMDMSEALRVMRGGAFDRFELNLRSADRNRYNQIDKISVLGFRCARTDE